jgi:hypothetical protein
MNESVSLSERICICFWERWGEVGDRAVANGRACAILPAYEVKVGNDLIEVISNISGFDAGLTAG